MIIEFFFLYNLTKKYGNIKWDESVLKKACAYMKITNKNY
jgi:hypothetical protein